jgi:uncharacterized protein (DUF3820 family)
MLMPFGKFRNTELSDIPERYLRWCQDYLTVEPELQCAIEEELLSRSLQRLIDKCVDCSAETRTLIRQYIRAAEDNGLAHALLTKLKAICAEETVH